MSIQKLIKEALAKSPLGVKAALEEELRVRVAEAVSGKMEAADLDEEIKDGDKVSWHDPDLGKNVTGVVTMASGMKRKGIKHAQVRIDNSHGTTTKVPHSQLKKIDEEVDQIDEGLDFQNKTSRSGASTTHIYHNGKHLGTIAKHFTKSNPNGSYRIQYNSDTIPVGSKGLHAHEGLPSQEAAKKLVSKHVNESLEQIDEISKKTLGSYIKKARQSSDKARDVEDRAYEKANWEKNPRKADRLYDLAIKASKTVDKREKGTDKAINKLAEAFLDEAAHVWYDIGHWHDNDKFGPIDAALAKGEDIAHAATHKEYKHIPDRYIGIPVNNKALISHMDKHARLADVDIGDKGASVQRLSPVKKFGDYELTVMPSKSKDEKGDITKAFAHVRNMEKLGVPHHDNNDYGQTVAVEVHNTKTGDTTKHHVYQADMSSRPDEKHLRAVSVRSIGAVGSANKPHAEVIRKFLEQN